MPPRKKNVLSLPVPKIEATTGRLKAALAKRKKSELVDVIADIASANRGIQRQLESRFGMEAPPEELIAATRAAIADATDFDEREINDNFDYDDHMTIFINGKQKRVPRPLQIEGMDVDEFIRRNADPIWLHQNGMWEYMTCDDEDDRSC